MAAEGANKMIQPNSEKLVSAIIPVYNCEKYIEKCLRSVVVQSYRNIEILVVNDGSTDSSQEIIDKISSFDTRVKALYQENRGVAAARNYALSFANGDYYIFIDGDDFIGSDYIKDLVECAVKNQSELVICGYTLTYTNKTKTVSPGLYKKNEKEEWAYRISSVLGRLYNSEFWKKNNLHFITEEARAEDVPIALFANAVANNVEIICKTDYFYVQREGSAMNSKKKVLFGFPYIAFEEMYYKVQKREMTNSRAFFDMGVIKFFAMFKYVIYLRANRTEKKRFSEYVHRLLDRDFDRMRIEWKNLRKNIDLPLTHKIAVSLFLMQMNMGRQK